MRIPRIYLEDKINKPIITLTGENVHYLKNVLRLKENNQVLIRTFSSIEYTTVVVSMQVKEIILKIVGEKKIITTKLRPPIHLYLSLVKSKTLTSIIQKITELGVEHFHPIESEYSNLKMKEFNISRYKKVALSALEQCGREIPLVIHSPKKLQDLLLFREKFLKPENTNLLAYENATNPFPTRKVGGNEIINIFIGPEGGISLPEKELLEKLNFHSVSLSPNILRVETATLFMLAKIL